MFLIEIGQCRVTFKEYSRQQLSDEAGMREDRVKVLVGSPHNSGVTSPRSFHPTVSQFTCSLCNGHILGSSVNKITASINHPIVSRHYKFEVAKNLNAICTVL